MPAGLGCGIEDGKHVIRRFAELSQFPQLA
jgi:hypothetical protein